jgi:DNA-binding NarL/FixJ family response regulator
MRVIVADDQIEVRSAIRLLLEEKAGMEVVGEARDSESLVRLIKTSRPDLVILDWELAEAKPGEGMLALKAVNPQLDVLVLSSRPQVENAAVKAGARAFVCKSDPPETLLKAIQKLTAQNS